MNTELPDKYKDEIEKLQKMIEIISHDIRNPLSVILAQAEVQKEKFLKEKQECPKYLEKIIKSAKHINNIINMVKHLRSLECGKMEIPVSSVNLQEVIGDIEDLFEDQLSAKKLSLKIELPSLKKLVLADVSSLTHQVIGNIISNSIKFSKENGQIGIKVEELSEKTIIEIYDNGIGIPTALLENIFRSDLKTSRKGTAGELGTGFGMPIIKQYIELFGGNLSISSKSIEQFPQNHGTTIKITLKNK